MIKEILNNRFFIIILYLIGILFFIKIDSSLLPPCLNKYCLHPIGVFFILIIIMILSHYNISLGLLASLIYLYFIITTSQIYTSYIKESFENKDDEDSDDDNNEEEEDDDDDDNQQEEQNLQKLNEEVKNDDDDDDDDDKDIEPKDEDDSSSEEN